MSGEKFRISRSGQGAYELYGVLDINHVEKLKEFLEEALVSGEDLEVSLAHLQHIDLSALQVLISFKNTQSISTGLHVSGLSPEVEEVLAVCGLRTALLA